MSEAVDRILTLRRGKEVRCPEPGCRRMLCRGDIKTGSKIEVKCPRCKRITLFVFAE